jgi:hypothetical protein
MSLVNEQKKGYNQLVLRSIAMICTVLAIASHTVVPNLRFFGYLEWVAFPIFAYLLAEGLDNTMSRGLYGARLLLFAALSEVPFDLMMSGRMLDYRQQNVLFTLFIGYIIIVFVDFVRTKADNLVLTIAAEIAGLFFGRYLIAGLRCAYPRFAMAFIMLFYVARHVRYEKVMELLVTLVIAVYFSNQTFATPKINGLQYDLSVQFFAVLALIFIWLYNGERGKNTLPVRYISYGFFPVAMLLFWYLSSRGIVY